MCITYYDLSRHRESAEGLGQTQLHLSPHTDQTRVGDESEELDILFGYFGRGILLFFSRSYRIFPS